MMGGSQLYEFYWTEYAQKGESDTKMAALKQITDSCTYLLDPHKVSVSYF
jgi:hypothetical protein